MPIDKTMPLLISPWYTIDQKETIIKNTKKYKSYRVKLACLLRDLFQQYDISFFIEGGTALGAYRKGEMIPHDDDFDYAVIGTEELLIDLEKKLLNKLPKEYKVRMVTTYCKKLEIYEPKFGKTMLDKNTDFNNITVDFLLYKDHPDDSNCLQMQYFRRPYHKSKFPKEIIFPLSETKFENEWFPCPNNQLEFLKIYYGYLGEDSYFDPYTNLYRKQDSKFKL